VDDELAVRLGVASQSFSPFSIRGVLYLNVQRIRKLCTCNDSCFTVFEEEPVSPKNRVDSRLVTS
jgi:hypothetical protein